MHVPNSQHRLRDRWRPPLAAAWLFALALTGSAQAVEFDASLRAPMVKSQGELKTQAQDISAKFAGLRDTAPTQLITNASLARDQFDLRWRIESAIDARQPLDEFGDLGITPRGDGSYSVDLGEHPEWNNLHELMAGMLSRANLEASAPELISRGFRPEDVETLKQYVAANNPDTAASAATLPIALGFARTVRKFDTAKRPVPESLVASYMYQRSRASSESNRLWIQALLDQLDAQRGRVLMSTFFELKPVAVWVPEDRVAGLQVLLAEVRRPDFEARVKAEALEVAP